MYKCRKCEKEFRTLTEWKNHEFDCIDYEIAQILELEKVKMILGDKLQNVSYEVTPDSFIDTDDEILHKSIHFELYMDFRNEQSLMVTDRDLRMGWLCSSEDIIKYIEDEQMDNEVEEEFENNDESFIIE